MSKTEFSIAESSTSFFACLKEFEEFLSSSGIANTEEILLNIKDIQNSEILKVAFIGQFSSGKSTIISALTGNRDIKISADIATDRATDYNWNNIILTDTPGLYTDRKDHDAITLKKIEDSHLLIFCLTSQLFDSYVIDNFKKLAFEKHYMPKMLLVVNKMNLERGSFDFLVKNYTCSLNKALSPYELDNFPHAFIDAHDYIEGLDEKDDQQIELSRFLGFIELLNDFARKNQAYAQLDTVLRRSISLISDLQMSLQNAEQNELFSVLNVIEFNINKMIRKLKKNALAIITKLLYKIIEYGNQITGRIGTEKVDFNYEIDVLHKKISEQILSTQKELEDEIERQIQELNLDNSEFVISDSFHKVLKDINARKIKISESNVEDLTKTFVAFDKTGVVAEKLTNSLSKVITDENVIKFFKPEVIRGSAIHSAIKKVSNFFGHTNKPWEIVNIAKGLGKFFETLTTILSKFLKFFPIIGVVIEAFNFFRDEKQAANLVDLKSEIDQEISRIAMEITDSMEDAVNSYIIEAIQPELDRIMQLKDSLLKEQETNSELAQKLSEIKNKMDTIFIQLNHYIKDN